MGAINNANKTSHIHFILVGFSDFPLLLQTFLLWIIFFIYLASVVGNTLIIVLATLDPLLQNPMYFFLRNLSFLELIFISATVPRMLITPIVNILTISFLECALQMFVFSSMGVSECVFLGVMAYDRYLAICNPLLYRTIMTPRICVVLVAASWVWGVALSLGQSIFILSWPYCGPHIINHFFCDMPAVLTLACADTFPNLVSIFVAYVVGGLFPLALILFSYTHIVSTILRMNSAVGRRKVFSTCSSHLFSVSLFYGSTMFMHLRIHSSHSDAQDKLLALLYSVIAPLLNPLIYSLRNKEIKSALGRFLYKHQLCSNGTYFQH